MPSTVDSPRTCSSVSNTVGPFLLLSSIGRIWLLKCPAAIAAAARLWLSTANVSCCSRVMPHRVATFSAVTPMWMVSNGSVSAPTIMSMSLASPMRAPQRCVTLAYAARLMLSAPPATAASVSPSRMYCDALTIACSPLPQRRFRVSAPVSWGKPPLTQATRDRYMSLASVWITLPKTHWPTSLGIDLGAAQRFLDHLAPPARSAADPSGCHRSRRSRCARRSG